MSNVDTDRMQVLERFLDLTAYRHGLIASNISNIDTPGYRTRDVNFQQEVNRILQSPEAASSVSVQPVQGLMERPDGNNVSLDREGLLLAQTQLQYHMGIQLMREEIHRISLAITEGK